MDIVIVGGGTAGWMTAARLSKSFTDYKHNVRIQLVESPDIPRVGVGEATVPGILNFFSSLGLAEYEWMIHCQATYKLAIKYVNWTENNFNNTFWHPFFNPSHHWLATFQPQWLNLWNERGEHPFADYFESTHLCKLNKAPFGEEPLPEPGGSLPYAYHFDAGLLSAFLEKYSINLGVKHLKARVTNVNVLDNGYIESVDTDSQGQIKGDLFIDCTGFKSLLLSEALDEPFESFHPDLMCDRALAVQVPYQSEQDEIEPYTTSTAMTAGWAWNIPLYYRKGTGYVYCSQFASDDEAEAEFRQHLGKQADNLTMNKIRMRVGRSERFWVGNCVGIGLSAGFVEPLESSGLFLLQTGIDHLLEAMPTAHFDPVVVETYNDYMRTTYDQVKDFLVAHYCISKRKEPFWQYVQHDTPIPDSLKEVLDIWRHDPRHLMTEARLPRGGFYDLSYMCIFAGMEYLPLKVPPLYQFLPSQLAEKQLNEVKERAMGYKDKLPNQRQWLNEIHGVAGR